MVAKSIKIPIKKQCEFWMPKTSIFGRQLLQKRGMRGPKIEEKSKRKLKGTNVWKKGTRKTRKLRKEWAGGWGFPLRPKQKIGKSANPSPASPSQGNQGKAGALWTLHWCQRHSGGFQTVWTFLKLFQCVSTCFKMFQYVPSRFFKTF